ncbi:MAG TPA: PH domain-containing protein [Kofleriaceae bacterium]|nr:PH domain-containing protein [Kofleriaceae bacterium]
MSEDQETEAAIGADGRERRLDPAAVRAEALSWWISAGVLAAIGLAGVPLLVAAAAPSGPVTAAVVAGLGVLVLALAAGAVWWPALAYRHTSYVLGPTGLEIRHGVWWRAVTAVPRSRVQYIDVVSGPIARRFGLATLTIHTAGTRDAAVRLEGLSRRAALAIRDLLTPDRPDDGV